MDLRQGARLAAEASLGKIELQRTGHPVNATQSVSPSRIGLQIVDLRHAQGTSTAIQRDRGSNNKAAHDGLYACCTRRPAIAWTGVRC